MPLSTKQMEYLALAWQCFDSEPKIDYEKFRTIANLASAASARELMRVTKKKLKEEYGALNGNDSATATPKSAATPKSTNGTGKKRGRPARAAWEKADADDGDDDDDDDDGEEGSASPSVKRARKAAGKKKTVVVKAEPVEEEQEQEQESEEGGELL
ncbi:Hypothetical predicted protein [Lecanosticta acicola]|uniref:Uncharacterized protein n=1 Tax=Lecanosticta acicola TaxID=111012 RepID=A0AAI9E9R4_9PEZI|nr:Hypothetical predicted protein [Lecanosticta acicola]